MIYLTVYVEGEGEVRSHQSPDPLHFAREVEARVLYRAVIDGVVIEDDGSVLDDLHTIGSRCSSPSVLRGSRPPRPGAGDPGCLQQQSPC